MRGLRAGDAARHDRAAHRECGSWPRRRSAARSSWICGAPSVRSTRRRCWRCKPLSTRSCGSCSPRCGAPTNSAAYGGPGRRTSPALRAFGTRPGSSILAELEESVPSARRTSPRAWPTGSRTPTRRAVLRRHVRRAGRRRPSGGRTARPGPRTDHRPGLGRRGRHGRARPGWLGSTNASADQAVSVAKRLEFTVTGAPPV